MKKHIFITNGTGGCGKDTFAEFLLDHTYGVKCSSIDKVKQIARECGWIGGKTERDRKFLSDLKLLTTAYSDLAFRDLKRIVEWFHSNEYDEVLIIDIREPEEIERAKVAFGAKTILIKNDRVAPITSNMADANVNNYNYDYVIENNGTLEELKETVKAFAIEVGLIEKENV